MLTQREIVRLCYQAYDAGNVDAEELRRHAHPSFRFHPRPGWPGRDWYGYDDMPQLWADLRATFKGYELVPVRWLDAPAGWEVVEIASSTGLADDGPRLTDHLFHVWRFEDGQVAEAWTLTSDSDPLAFISDRRNAA